MIHCFGCQSRLRKRCENGANPCVQGLINFVSVTSAASRQYLRLVWLSLCHPWILHLFFWSTRRCRKCSISKSLSHLRSRSPCSNCSMFPYHVRFLNLWSTSWRVILSILAVIVIRPCCWLSIALVFPFFTMPCVSSFWTSVISTYLLILSGVLSISVQLCCK